MNNFSKSVKEKVKNTIFKYNMLDNTDTVLVGFSGGADSVCLLHTLNSLKEELGFKLKAAHLNHGIRGEEAKRDELFAEEFCKRFDIPFNSSVVDCIGAFQNCDMSLEQVARNIRYDFFNSLCDGKTKIATAHNANDNAETIIFNLTRGTSLNGVCGIPVVRDNIIRPLIKCSREDIEGYCEENGLDFVTDSTNLSDNYTRNKIRHNILPVLSEINPSYTESFMNFSESAERINDFIVSESQSILKKVKKYNGSVDVLELNKYHNAVTAEVIKLLFAEISNLTLDSGKMNKILLLLKDGGRIQIYGDIFAENVKNEFRFFIKNTKIKDCTVKVGKLPFECEFNGFYVNLKSYTNYSKKVNDFVLDNVIDCDKIYGSLYFRTRKDGDKLSLNKRKVTKTLKKLFNEENVPVENRERLPILCDEKGIVWVYGFGVDKRVSAASETCNIILVGGNDNDR
ncbi:MAG: tRNA lysidine(34) synthetase TilS [Acutalibacteraceae bacterium]